MYICISVFYYSFLCSQQLKIFESRNQPREKNLSPGNTHTKKFQTDEKKLRTHEILKRKHFGPTRYLYRHDGTIALDPRDPQWHATGNIQCTLLKFQTKSSKKKLLKNTQEGVYFLVKLYSAFQVAIAGRYQLKHENYYLTDSYNILKLSLLK